jgi:multiple sugar transport system substrate-binding protein
MPGPKKVLNWDAGMLEACTKDNCPYAIDGVKMRLTRHLAAGAAASTPRRASSEGRGLCLFLLCQRARRIQCRPDHRQVRFNPYRIWQLSHSSSGKTGGMSEKPAA